MFNSTLFRSRVESRLSVESIGHDLPTIPGRSLTRPEQNAHRHINFADRRFVRVNGQTIDLDEFRPLPPDLASVPGIYGHWQAYHPGLFEFGALLSWGCIYCDEDNRPNPNGEYFRDDYNTVDIGVLHIAGASSPVSVA